MSKYCTNCGQEVSPEKKFSGTVFVILLLFAGVPGILYYLWVKIVRSGRCPQCKGQNWGRPESETTPEAA